MFTHSWGRPVICCEARDDTIGYLLNSCKIKHPLDTPHAAVYMWFAHSVLTHNRCTSSSNSPKHWHERSLYHLEDSCSSWSKTVKSSHTTQSIAGQLCHGHSSLQYPKPVCGYWTEAKQLIISCHGLFGYFLLCVMDLCLFLSLPLD